MKLKSGLEVTLRPITFVERQGARGASQVAQGEDGSYFVKNAYEARALFVRAGVEKIIGIKFETFEENGRKYATDETLNRLSDEDFIEITEKVVSENTQGDYEKKE